ncbi:MAG: topoisomerase C-terminal repeat-containing protein, partial [Cyanobacteria bacterium P01_H01_bin.121]
TLDAAVGLLALPRLLGEHPETGGKVQAGLGRFGPYVVHTNGKDKDYRSLKLSEGDDVLKVNLQRALELLAQPKGGRGRRGATKPPLKALGAHPEDNEPVNLYEGPYGIYVKHGKVNAGLPEGESVETMTLEKALELLAAKASTKKTTRKRKTTSKASANKTSASKTSSASSTAKKTTAKKATTRKRTTKTTKI